MGTFSRKVVIPEEAVRLRALSAVPVAEVSCTPHAPLNLCSGSADIVQYSEEKLFIDSRRQTAC